jgi:hypothetical protein
VLITFDIDDTIRLHGSSQKSERPVISWVARLFYREPIRIGFIQVCNDLRNLGCQIGIYTTSSRSVGYIRRWMRCYGLKPDIIINSVIHERVIAGRFKHDRPPSKHPGLFGIDLHIDDSHGVAVEAKRFGFRALIVATEDMDWGARIVQAVRVLPNNQTKSEQDASPNGG